MLTVALQITRKPADGVVTPLPGSAKPLFRGNGDTDYACGHCGSVMAAGMGPTQHVIVDTAICSACGAENEFPHSLRA